MDPDIVIVYRRLAQPRPGGRIYGPNGVADIEFDWDIADPAHFHAVYATLPQEMCVLLRNESDKDTIPVFGLGHVVRVRNAEAVRHWWSRIMVQIPPGESVVMTSRWLEPGEPYAYDENPVVL